MGNDVEHTKRFLTGAPTTGALTEPRIMSTQTATIQSRANVAYSTRNLCTAPEVATNPAQASRLSRFPRTPVTTG